VDENAARGSGRKFPEKVTAFREEMYVHGRYGLPCKRCGPKIQRIRYASNETNYCPRCQTGGKLLADAGAEPVAAGRLAESLDEMERAAWPVGTDSLTAGLLGQKREQSSRTPNGASCGIFPRACGSARVPWASSMAGRVRLRLPENLACWRLCRSACRLRCRSSARSSNACLWSQNTPRRYRAVCAAR